MKKVLVIGDDSYIGLSFYKFSKDRFDIKLVSSRENAWKNADFCGYDSVLHCAGIAHVKETKKNAQLYYEVNRDLAYDTAKAAKEAGAGQFIFISTMNVYGMKRGEITKETVPDPKSNYGKSKLEAEKLIQALSGGQFKAAIVRPPMVYGNGCKGNFPRLVKLAGRTPVFPDLSNKRSMIYIDNLCSFFNMLIENEAEGIFLPHNKEYVSTAGLVKCAALHRGGHVFFTRIFNPAIRLLRRFVPVFSKLFCDLYYTMQGDEEEYNAVSFGESIRRSVSGDEL